MLVFQQREPKPYENVSILTERERENTESISTKTKRNMKMLVFLQRENTCMHEYHSTSTKRTNENVSIPTKGEYMKILVFQQTHEYVGTSTYNT